MKKEKGELIIYLYISKKLLEMTDVDGLVDRKKVLTYLGKICHFPKSLRQKIINVMCDLNLIEQFNKKKIKVLVRN